MLITGTRINEKQAGGLPGRSAAVRDDPSPVGRPAERWRRAAIHQSLNGGEEALRPTERRDEVDVGTVTTLTAKKCELLPIRRPSGTAVEGCFGSEAEGCGSTTDHLNVNVVGLVGAGAPREHYLVAVWGERRSAFQAG